MDIEEIEEFFDNSQDETPKEKQTKESVGNTIFKNKESNIDDWLKRSNFLLDKTDRDAERKLKHKTQKLERKLRRQNANKAFIFSAIWAVFIILFITTKALYPEININPTEFMFICGTLTTSVFAFYLTVIRSLFPNYTKSIVPPSNETD